MPLFLIGLVAGLVSGTLTYVFSGMALVAVLVGLLVACLFWFGRSLWLIVIDL